MPEIYPSIVRSIQENVYDTIQGTTIGSIASPPRKRLDIRASVGTSTSPINSAPNLLTYTEDFSNAAWAKNNVSIATDVEGTADRLTLTVGSGAVYRDVNLTGNHCFSIEVKKGTQGNRVSIYQGSTPFGGQYDFNLDAPTGNYTALGNGWFRIWFVRNWVGVANTIRIGGYGGGPNTSGDNFLIRNAQLETGTVPTGYVAHPVINKAVTGVGFQPKVVLPWGHNTPSTSANHAALGFGACTTSAQSSISVDSRNGLTTSATNRRHSASTVYQGMYGGNVEESAAYSSFDADGFTLNWSPLLGTRLLNHICLGGADLEVSLTQQQMNGTNAAQSFAHGLTGGAPTAVLFFSAINASAPPLTGSNLHMGIGGWAGSNQFTAGLFSSNGVTTTSTRRFLSASASMAYCDTLIRRSMSVSSVDATNVNVTYPVGDGYQFYFWMLAIRGAKCQVGTFDCNGSTSPLTISTTGITPKLFLPVFVPVGVDTPGTVNNSLYLTIGASDGTNNVSCGISDENAVTTTNARRWQSSSTLAEYSVAGSKMFEANAAFSGESVILTPSSNINSAWGQGAYLILGS